MNKALWLRSPGGPLEVGPAPYPAPAEDEVVVRVQAVAINPADAISGLLRRIISPRLRYPAVIGSDVAGVVTRVGKNITHVRVGDRALGYATGLESSRAGSAGAFQNHVAILGHLCTPLPVNVSVEEAAVLPLGLATAAAGLYEMDQLALPLPDAIPPSGDEVVIVWGASSSVGCNAVQLAVASGYSVLATASPRNHDLVLSLGAEQVLDYKAANVDDDLIGLIGGRPLAGSIAVGGGSLTHLMRIARRTPGSRRISSVYPDPITRTRALLAKTRGLRVSIIWGSTPVTSPVGPAIFECFLPAALTDGRFIPAPLPDVVGVGLSAIPEAVERMRQGVSGSKLVVRIENPAETE